MEPIIQEECKFTPISVRNISDYIPLGEIDDFLYTIHPARTIGFVFYIPDLQKGQHAIPVVRVSLKETPIGYKQPFSLRICASFSHREDIISTWYRLYVDMFKGIANNSPRNFNKITKPEYKLSKVNLDTMEYTEDINQIKEADILILEKL